MIALDELQRLAEGATAPMTWKPCPFCGGTDIRHDCHRGAGTGMWHRGDDVYSMCCYSCGATVPNRYNLALVNEAWNRRTALEELK